MKLISLLFYLVYRSFTCHKRKKRATPLGASASDAQSGWYTMGERYVRKSQPLICIFFKKNLQNIECLTKVTFSKILKLYRSRLECFLNSYFPPIQDGIRHLPPYAPQQPPRRRRPGGGNEEEGQEQQLRSQQQQRRRRRRRQQDQSRSCGQEHESVLGGLFDDVRLPSHRLMVWCLSWTLAGH